MSNRISRRELFRYTGMAGAAAAIAGSLDAVLHCGARSLVGESVADPARYYRQNVAGGGLHRGGVGDVAPADLAAVQMVFQAARSLAGAEHADDVRAGLDEMTGEGGAEASGGSCDQHAGHSAMSFP